MDRSLYGSAASDLTAYTVIYLILLLLYVGRPEGASEKNSMCPRTKAAMMLN